MHVPSLSLEHSFFIVLPHLGSGGAQKVALLAAEHYKRRGVEVVVVTFLMVRACKRVSSRVLVLPVSKSHRHRHARVSPLLSSLLSLSLSTKRPITFWRQNAQNGQNCYCCAI